MALDMRTALTVAGSDSIGGAGIQADVKAMSAVGVHAATVITALTAQNTTGVNGILPVSEEFIKAQLEAVLKDSDIKAIKTGMLYSAEIVGTVADILEDHEAPLVVDPVMVAGTGSTLMQDDLANALRRKLLPICELVTPNKSEAEVLAKMKIKTKDDERFAAELIGKQGSAVLMKGGHYNTPTVVDFLYLSSEFTKMEYPRLKKAGHGSGCVLSSYITANMAKGMDVANAVFKSREMIQDAIASQYVIGHGDMVVNPCVKEGESDGFMVLDALDSAASRILDIVPEEFVPKNGMNIAMAMRNAAGPEEIAAIEKEEAEVRDNLLHLRAFVVKYLKGLIRQYGKKYPRMTQIAAGNGNKDGYSIRAAALDLAKRTERRRILMVLSDGLPSGYFSEAEAIDDVRTAVQTARRRGLLVIPIIYTARTDENVDAYRHMYEKSMIFADSVGMLGEFERLLMKLVC